MMMPYSFSGRPGDMIDIWELDEFLAEHKALCQRYDIGFLLMAFDEDDFGLNIVPFDQGQWDIFTARLAQYTDGVPFLDAAKRQWKQRADDEYQKMLQATKRQAVEKEEKLKAEGITLADGHYKLVRE